MAKRKREDIKKMVTKAFSKNANAGEGVKVARDFRLKITPSQRRELERQRNEARARLYAQG